VDNRGRSFIVVSMNGNELAVFGLLILAAGLVHYRFAEPISAALRRWIPDSWESDPGFHRLTGQLMSFSGIILFAATTLAG
jgi:hypothetical protein